MASSSARETAYEILRRQIIHLELKPGQSLNDKELTTQLGMSRTPVREALIMLHLSNLLIVRPQSGTFVAPIDVELVDVEQFTRCAIEKEMVSLVCGKIQDKDIAKYKENLHFYRVYNESMADEKEERLLELDNNFHRLIFSIAGKERIYDNVNKMMLHSERLRQLTLKFSQDNSRILQDHEDFLDAIIAGDVTQAHKCLERHMSLYKSHIGKIQDKFPEYFGTME